MRALRAGLRRSGPLDGPAPRGPGAGDRGHRTALANQILSHYGLKVEDWGGSKYIVRDRKGRTELVQHLGDLWPAAAKLAGGMPDPLDPDLLGAISAAREG